MWFDFHSALPSRLPDPCGSVPRFNMRTHAPPWVPECGSKLPGLYDHTSKFRIETYSYLFSDANSFSLTFRPTNINSEVIKPIFFKVDLFTTTTKQNNHETQHALGQRSAGILKIPLRGNTCCFPQDRNLDTGFIGIGQCSGLRTLYKSNASTFISSDSYSLSEDIFDAGGSNARHHSYYSTNFQEVCTSLTALRDCVSVVESKPSITGNFPSPTMILCL